METATSNQPSTTEVVSAEVSPTVDTTNVATPQTEEPAVSPKEEKTQTTTETKEEKEGGKSAEEEAPKPDKANPAGYQQRKGKSASTWNNNNRRADASTRAGTGDRREPRRKKDFVLETQAWPSLAETKGGGQQTKAKSGAAQTKEPRSGAKANKSKDEGRKKKVVSWVPFKDVGQAQNPRHKFNNHNNQNSTPNSGHNSQMAANAVPFTPAHLSNPTPLSTTNSASVQPSVAAAGQPAGTTTVSSLNPNTANFFPSNTRQKRPYNNQNNNNNNRGNYRGRPNNNRRGGGGNMGGRYPAQFPDPFYAGPGQFRFYPPNFVAEPLEGEALKEAVRKQVEYYFSVDNLCKDIYLRSRMDKDGFVPLDMIAAFNKVKYLVKDRSILIEALTTSSNVEYDAERHLLRKREGWKEWLASEAGTDTDSKSEVDETKGQEDEKTAKGENDTHNNNNNAKAVTATAVVEEKNSDSGKVSEEGTGREGLMKAQTQKKEMNKKEEEEKAKGGKAGTADKSANSSSSSNSFSSSNSEVFVGAERNDVAASVQKSSSSPSSNIDASQKSSEKEAEEIVKGADEQRHKDKDTVGHHVERASEISASANGVLGKAL